jgi:hypothetical protein
MKDIKHNCEHIKLCYNKYSHFGGNPLWNCKYVRIVLQKDAEQLLPDAQLLIILCLLFKYLADLCYITANIITYAIHRKRQQYGY